MTIDYKISQTITDEKGRMISCLVRYYEGTNDPKTGQRVRTACLAEERLAPMKAMTDAEVIDSLNARMQAKYPKDDMIAVQQSVDLATNIDKSYPIINERGDIKPVPIEITPIDEIPIEPVKGADVTPKGG